MKTKKPNTFSKGMFRDIDPHYQPKESYKDAQNARLSSEAGNTLSLENMKGNLFIDHLIPGVSNLMKLTINGTLVEADKFSITSFEWTLGGVDVGFPSSAVFNKHFATAGNTSTSAVDRYVFVNEEDFYNDLATWIRATAVANNAAISASSSGSYIYIWSTAGTSDALSFVSSGNFTGATNTVNFTGFTDVYPAAGELNIMGYYSFPDFMIIFTQTAGSGDQNGQIWKLTVDKDGLVDGTSKAAGNWELKYYGGLNFNREYKIIAEGVLENNCFKRVYWTDNYNHLRSFNFVDNNSMALTSDELSVFPIPLISKPILNKITGGELRVGMYQYCYRLKGANGAVSGMSPMSNLIHIVKENETLSHVNYEGAEVGEVTSKGIECTITNLDYEKYNKLEIIGIKYETFGAITETYIIEEKTITSESVTFIHDKDTGEPFTIPELLENKSSWHYCKDIAVKDNRLFAANLRNDGFDLTMDTVAKSYNLIENGTSNAIDEYDEQGTTYTGNINRDYTSYRYLPYGGVTDTATGTSVSSASETYTDEFGTTREIRILGGVSDGFSDSAVGGVRFTFRTLRYLINDNKDYVDSNKGKYVQAGEPYVSVGTRDGNILPNTTTITGSTVSQVEDPYKSENNILEFSQAELSDDSGATGTYPYSPVGWNSQKYEYKEGGFFGGPISPYWTDVMRGYQREETYRFAIVFYDKNGNPDFARWIGDIKMPSCNDVFWRPEIFEGDWLSYTGSAYAKHSQTTGSLTTLGGQGKGLKVEKQKYGYRVSYRDNAGNIWGQAVVPYFEVRLSAADLAKVSGYSIVRAERTPSDKTIVGNGILHQTCRYANPGEIGNFSSSGPLNLNHIDQDDETNDDMGAKIGILPNPITSYISGMQKNNDAVVSDAEAGDSHDYRGLYTFDCPDHHFDLETFSSSANFELIVDSQLTAHNWSKDGLYYDDDDKLHQKQLDLDARDKKFTSSGGEKLKYNQLSNYWNSGFTGADVPGGNKNAWNARGVWFGFRKLNARHKRENVGVHEYSNIEYITRFTKMFTSFEHQVKRGSYYGDTTINNVGSTNYDLFSTVSTSSTFGDYTEATRDRNRRSIDFIQSVDPGSEISQSDLAGYTKNNNAFKNAGRTGRAVIDPDNRFGDEYKKNHAKMYVRVSGESGENEDAWVGHRTSHGSKTLFIATSKPICYWNYAHKEYPFGQIGTAIQSACNINAPASSVDYEYFSIGGEGSSAGYRHKLLASVRRKVSWTHASNEYPGKGQLSNQYGGFTDAALSNTSYISCTHFKPVFNSGNSPLNPGVDEVYYKSYVGGGDTFVTMYNYTKLFMDEEEWENGAGNGEGDKLDTDGITVNELRNGSPGAKSHAVAFSFPCETQVNTYLRHGDYWNKSFFEATDYHSDMSDDADDPWVNRSIYSPTSDSLLQYNKVYSQENTTKRFVPQPLDWCSDNLHFPYTVAYSDLKLAGDSVDGWKVFGAFDFFDLDASWGHVNNLFSLRDELYTLQDRGVAKLSINPRSVVPSQDGISTVIKTGAGNVIDREEYLITNIGNQHQHGLVVTNQAAYWIDVEKTKFIKLGYGEKGTLRTFKVSDSKGFKDYFRDLFDDETILDTPLNREGLTGGYDSSHDEIFISIKNSNIETTIAYNEVIDAFSSFYSFNSTIYISHKKFLYSPDPEYRNKLYLHNAGNLTTFYNNTRASEFSVTFIVNDAQSESKVFDSLEIIAKSGDGTNTNTNYFTDMEFSNSYQTQQDLTIINTTTSGATATSDTRFRIREGVQYIPTRSLDAGERLRDTYLQAKLKYQPAENVVPVRFNIFAINTNLRKSFI